MPALRRQWTPDAVRALFHEGQAWPRYELIGGELLVTPAPASIHQFVVDELLLLLAPYVRSTRIGAVLTSPADLQLKAGTITQPDLFIVPANTRIAGEHFEWSDVKSLLLAVEVLSPSTQDTDRRVKRDFYLQNGVAEYWIIDIDGRLVERSTPAERTPDVVRDVLRWAPRDHSGPPFELNVRAMFESAIANQNLIGSRE